jgi:hypothetical protein
MRIIHKCPSGQGSGSASPKGRARALAPSQSYRFVKNSHDMFSHGRRPQIPPKKFPNLCEVGRAKYPRASGLRPGEAAGEIILGLEPGCPEFLPQLRSLAVAWLYLRQLTEPHENIMASSPLQVGEKP